MHAYQPVPPAHLGARRHRLLVARKLNEWRDCAGVPCVEEPVHGEGFGMIISGKLEVLGVTGKEEDYIIISGELEVLGVTGKEEDYVNEDGGMDGYDDVPPSAAPPPMYPGHEHGHERSPVIASPTNMNFENPQMGYENYTLMVAPAAAYYGGAAAPAPPAAFLEERRFAPPAFEGYHRPRSGAYDAYEGMIVGGGGAPGAAAFAMMV